MAATKISINFSEALKQDDGERASMPKATFADGTAALHTPSGAELPIFSCFYMQTLDEQQRGNGHQQTLNAGIWNQALAIQLGAHDKSDHYACPEML